MLFASHRPDVDCCEARLLSQCHFAVFNVSLRR